MTINKRMSLNFSDTEELEKFINDVYFTNINGKKNNYIDKYIIIKENDIYYTILSNLNYDIKLTNDIIEGNMLFKMKENKEAKEIYLSPISEYCIEKEDKYVFY